MSEVVDDWQDRAFGLVTAILAGDRELVRTQVARMSESEAKMLALSALAAAATVHEHACRAVRADPQDTWRGWLEKRAVEKAS